MLLEFIAHACFRIQLDNELTFIIDPYDSPLFDGCFTYPKLEKEPCDFALVSHEHLDHNALHCLCDHAKRIEGDASGDGWQVKTIEADHDRYGGHRFGGKIRMHRLQADHITLLHVGDLGQRLDDTQLARIGHVDFVLLPVGQFYTLSVDDAIDLVARLRPTWTLICHYATPFTRLTMTGPRPFLQAFDQRLGSIHRWPSQVNLSDKKRRFPGDKSLRCAWMRYRYDHYVKHNNSENSITP